jgi:hypothetical protein
METGISRRGGEFTRIHGLAVALAVGLAAVALAGCGGGQDSAFSWLHPKSPPGDWRIARVPSGAELPYPPSWRRQHADPGAASAALIGPSGVYLGYLNITPRQGDETLTNWAEFRVDHNREEGDRGVKRLAAATGLHFLAGHGSCVKDAYATGTGARYIEIACLVTGTRGSSVIVGAAPPDRWGQAAPTIERAIAGVRT